MTPPLKRYSTPGDSLSAHGRVGAVAGSGTRRCRTVAGDLRRRKVTLAGAVFPALIESGEFRTQGLWLLRFDTMPYVALHENLPHDAAGAARVAEQIGSQIRAQIKDDTQVTLFLLFDALVPNISTLLDELYLQLANRVHYVGANAGSETFQPMPCLFDNARTIQNGVLLMLLQPHLGAMLAHGYRRAAQNDFGNLHRGQSHPADRLASRLRGVSGTGARTVRRGGDARKFLPACGTFSVWHHPRQS